MVVKVLVTGATGQIAYSLLPLIAGGQVFGEHHPVHLVLFSHTPKNQRVLEGIVMELVDCTYSMLRHVSIASTLPEAVVDVDYAFLLGSAARQPGETRRDLLAANVKIYREYGLTLNEYGKKTVKVLVVSNPANTCALVCMACATSIPRENFTALTRLDQNRAQAQIAASFGNSSRSCDSDEVHVRNVIVWGNHSPTQVPDARYAEISVETDGNPRWTALDDAAKSNANFQAFLENNFTQSVRQRGEHIISARKVSSCMSAAKAAADHMRDWACGTRDGRMVSMVVPSNGAYGIKQNLMFSFPVKCLGNGQWEIVEDLQIDDDIRGMLAVTQAELEQECDEALAALFQAE